MSEHAMPDSDKRAFAWGYLTALKMIRELKKTHGLSWERAVVEAGKRLVTLVSGPAAKAVKEAIEVMEALKGEGLQENQHGIL